MSGLAKVYEQIRERVDEHDGGGCRQRPPGKAIAVRMAYVDIERIGLEEGEVVYPSKGIKLQAGGQFGRLVVVCDKGCERPGLPAEDEAESKPVEDEIVIADAEPVRQQQREREVVKV